MNLDMRAYGDIRTLGNYIGTFLYAPFTREGSTYTLKSGWHTCRETAYNEFYKQKEFCLALYTGFVSPQKSEKEINGAYITYKKQIRRAVRIIHLYERAAGLKATSVVFKRLTSEKRPFAALAFFEGSRRWLSNPVMFSMFTLIIRNGKNFVNFGMPKTTKEFVKNIPSRKQGELYYFSAVKYWDCFIQNSEEIMRNAPTLARYIGAQGFFEHYTDSVQHRRFFKIWDNKKAV